MLALLFGFFILISCLTGVLLVFEEEITERIHSDRYEVEVPDSPVLPIDEMASKVSATLSQDVSIIGVTKSATPDRCYLFLLSKPKKAALCVNPYTGEVMGAKERLPFFQQVIRLHRWLLGQRPVEGKVSVGRWVMGVSTVALVVLLLTGIWMAQRRLLSKSKHRFRVARHQGLLRFCYDAHVVGGIFLTVFLLVRALTGLTWSFPAYRSAIYAAFGTEVEKKQGKEKMGLTPDFTVWQQALDFTLPRCGDYQSVTVSNGKVEVRTQQVGNLRAVDTYHFDRGTGEITSLTKADEQSTATRLKGWIYTLHTGAELGWFSRFWTFVTVLLGAFLPLSGYYLWWKRKLGSRK